MLEFLIEIDEKVLLFFNGMHSAWADHFMMDITGRVIWIPFYVILAVAMVWRYGWMRGLAVVALIGLAVGCSDMICDKLIRPYFERLRPSNLENEISAFVQVIFDEKHPGGYRSSAYGFPSCHAANTMALAAASCLPMRKWWYAVFVFFWATLLCYSRIYLGVHYPGDIAAGASVGFMVGLAAGWAAWRLTKSKVPERETKTSLAVVAAPVTVGALTFVYAAIIACF